MIQLLGLCLNVDLCTYYYRLLTITRICAQTSYSVPDYHPVPLQLLVPLCRFPTDKLLLLVSTGRPRKNFLSEFFSRTCRNTNLGSSGHFWAILGNSLAILRLLSIGPAWSYRPSMGPGDYNIVLWISQAILGLP